MNGLAMVAINAFILTLVISAGAGITSLTQEYGTENACENAKVVFRERLSVAKVLLLTCTRKG